MNEEFEWKVKNIAFLQIENKNLYSILADLDEDMVTSAINYLKTYNIFSKLSCFIAFQIRVAKNSMKGDANNKMRTFNDFMHKEKIKSDILIKNQQFYMFKDENVDFKTYIQEFEDFYTETEKSTTIITLYQ